MTSLAFQVDQLFYRVPGGIGTYIRELVPELRRADPDLDVTLFHARFGRPTPEAWMGGFPSLELPAGIRTLYPRWAFLGRPPLPAALDARIVHAPSPVSVPPARPGQALVVTVHDLAFERFPRAFPRTWRTLFRAGLRRAARNAAALVVPSANTAADVGTLTGVDPTRVHVVPLAASLPSVEPEAERTELGVPRPYVLFVGTLEARKNLVRLVRSYRRAVSTARLPHALVLAGPRGWGTAPLLREMRAGGPGRVMLTGPVRPERLDALYRHADAFVYPSLYEGFGLPVLEAMARGTPSIVSRASSLPEVAGDAALTVDPSSVPAMADALVTLLTRPEEAGRLREAGPRRAALFSWSRTARETLEVYRSLG